MSDENKACPVCAETIKFAAFKCRFCNTDLAAYAEARESEVEKDLFVGRPALLYNIGQLFPFLLVVTGACLWLAVGLETSNRYSVWFDLSLSIAICGILWFRLYLRHWSRHFQITTQRIKLERGLFSKVNESLELFRIDHFEVRKPAGQRLLGFASLHIFSSDAELSNFFVYGIPNVEALAETLRTCQLRERQRRGLSTFVRA